MSEPEPNFPADPICKKGLTLDQRFRLDEYLGQGPVHLVFAAHDLTEAQDCCLKFPKTKFRGNAGFSMRYRRDLLDLMMVSDPLWLTPSFLGEHENVPFQVLPLVSGLTLPQWFEESKRDERRLVQVLRRCLKTLSRLHRERKRIHGSIKPSNLYVNERDEPILLDLTATGRLEDHFAEKARSGEAVFCSPEQLSGERADWATDLYSLALVVYQALARRHPYFEDRGPQGAAGPENLLISLLGQLRSRPTPPSNFCEDVPRWADRFISRCLHPHPAERFQSLEEARGWLENHTQKEITVSAEHRTTPPAGREPEMKLLLEHLDKARNEEGGSVIRLRGELGCGKTRCLNWLTDQAKSKKMRVITVEPTSESGLHLQSVIQALGRDFPELLTEAQPVVESLLGIALEEPVLFVIRDIQQADDTLVEFLRELQGVLSDVSLFLILVDEETEFRSHEMEVYLAGLQSELKLQNLNRRAVGNIIEEKTWTAPSANLCSWVHKVSSGNALHASLLVEYLQNKKLVSDDFELTWSKSPPKERPVLNDLVEWKLEQLSELASGLLETAAVLGQNFRLSTLNAITYRDEDEVDLALGEGVSKGLLELADPGGAISYRFSHPIFKRFLLKRLQSRKKQRIHRLAAAFYSRGEPEPAKMAYHFLRAGDDPELFHWGSLAIRKAHQLGRRGECNYWMNVLLNRIPEAEWLGPPIKKARVEVSRDQTESLDLDQWTQWLQALSGRSSDFSDDLNPLLNAQHALSSHLRWDHWMPRTQSILRQLKNRGKDGQMVKRAKNLLRQEWSNRSTFGEPFPDS